MINYTAARAVAAIARTGSFEKAAAELNVTPSAVSQRVKHLEEQLGVVLVERGSPCTATEKGLWLCRHVESVGILEKELMEELPELADTPAQRVTLNMAANADSLGTWFLEAVAAFTDTSGYLVNIALDDEEHTVDWLRRGRVFAAVTAMASPVQGCRVFPLGALRYHATASPAFVARYFPRGVTAEALEQAPALTFNQKDRLQSDWARQVFAREVAFPTHWLPSTQSFLEASLAGMGWALNPASLAGEHLHAGRLVDIVPGATLDRPLFWQINRAVADQLEGLTQSVLAVARRRLV